jgi:BlaI family penicillinase repressor
MPDVPQISDAEWEVMKVVWEAGDAAPPEPLTAGEVVQRMAAAGGPGARWRPRTIKTLLSRLVQKGAVRADAEPGAARVYRYRAAVSREACVRQESRSFLRRVFDGDVAPALVHFLNASNLSRDDIERLKKVLDDEVAAAAGNGRKSAGKGRAS